MAHLQYLPSVVRTVFLKELCTILLQTWLQGIIQVVIYIAGVDNFLVTAIVCYILNSEVIKKVIRIDEMH